MYRKTEGGTAYSAAENAVANGKFEGITLVTTCRGSVEINRAQFYQALADSMRSRLLPESEQPLVQAIETGFAMHMGSFINSRVWRTPATRIVHKIWGPFFW